MKRYSCTVTSQKVEAVRKLRLQLKSCPNCSAQGTLTQCWLGFNFSNCVLSQLGEFCISDKIFFLNYYTNTQSSPNYFITIRRTTTKLTNKISTNHVLEVTKKLYLSVSDPFDNLKTRDYQKSVASFHTHSLPINCAGISC